MLPTEDAAWVGEELARRFGLPRWLFTLTATDANRTALRIARLLTGRPKVLVYSYCYHGSVDEAFAVSADGRTVVAGRERRAAGGRRGDHDRGRVQRRRRAGGGAGERRDRVRAGRAGDDQHGHRAAGRRATTTALRELRARVGDAADHRRDAHVLAPARAAARRRGGWSRTCSRSARRSAAACRAARSGCPRTSRRGCSPTDGRRLRGHRRRRRHAGRQRALAGGDAGDARLGADRRRVGAHDPAGGALRGRRPRRARRPAWNVTQLGCRAEYRFSRRRRATAPRRTRPRTPSLERYLHLHALNRGVLITPFHNMALMAPTTTAADVDRHTEVFAEAVSSLAG